jgi:hypothetical protein
LLVGTIAVLVAVVAMLVVVRAASPSITPIGRLSAEVGR